MDETRVEDLLRARARRGAFDDDAKARLLARLRRERGHLRLRARLRGVAVALAAALVLVLGWRAWSDGGPRRAAGVDCAVAVLDADGRVFDESPAARGPGDSGDPSRAFARPDSIWLELKGAAPGYAHVLQFDAQGRAALLSAGAAQAIDSGEAVLFACDLRALGANEHGDSDVSWIVAASTADLPVAVTAAAAWSAPLEHATGPARRAELEQRCVELAAQSGATCRAYTILLERRP